MAVGFVASASSGSQASVASFNIGTLGTGARAGIVFVATHNSATAVDTGVTWNGVAMTLLYSAADTNTEPGIVRAYFLDNVSNGTITVSRTNNATVCVGYAASISAAGATYVSQVVTEGGGGTVNTNADSSEAGTTGSGENAIDDGSPGTNSMRFAAYYSGAATPPAAGTNSTSLQVLDSTALGSRFVRETTAGQGSRSVGSATGTTDDWAYVGVAVSEIPNVSGTGAITVPAAIVSGTGAEVFTATGAVTVPAATVDGTGNHAFTMTGTGAITAPAATVAGTGAEVLTATGAVSAPAATVAGTGSEILTATGAISVPAPTVAGTGAEVFTATGAVSVPAPTVSGTGAEVFTATGTVTVPAPTVSGDGTYEAGAPTNPEGTGAISVPAPTVSGTGALVLTATGALTAPAATVSGTGAHLQAVTGTGALVAPAATVSGTALHIQNASGTGAILAPAATVAGTGVASGAGRGGGRGGPMPVASSEDDLILELLDGAFAWIT